MACSLAVEMQINKVSGRLLIVSDKITHQDIEHVIIDRNDFKARHDVNLTTIPINGQHFLALCVARL